MKSRLGFELSLSQQLKLSPSLVFSLELLQLPLLKLEEFLKNEIEENPLIEIDSLSEVYESSSHYYETGEEEEKPEPPALLSLREELLKQVALEFEGREREVAEFMVNNLDRRGLLTVSPEEISLKFSLPLEVVESVRERFKLLEPVGCGSLTVWELIEAQLKEMGAPRRLVSAVRLISSCKGLDEFLKKSSLSKEEFEELSSYLSRIDLFPFDEGFDAVPVKPDLKVWLERGEVKVEVLKPSYFNFKINSFYLKHASREELKRFVNEKYRRALYLKKAIESRDETLRKLALSLFKRQREFLLDGKTVKPLTITELAKELSLHESTLSRAVKDKFVETPFGVYPLRFFFRKGVKGISVEEVKALIRELIEKEDKRRPLSDSKIASILKERGVNVARRTVAKYREEMGIPGAYKRRVR
ncbi:RNA polymerase factor sigma-54 [Thermovibrio sp.]